MLGVDAKELSTLWHDAEFAAYRPVAETTKLPGSIARPVIHKEGGGEINVSPELSPDGSKVMFFSERDLFSIDLFLADAATGKIIRKVTDTATDAHFESLQFLGSAGAWDATGNRFVFPGVSKGDPVLTIVNVNNGKQEREVRVKEVDEILNPTWSSDGQSDRLFGSGRRRQRSLRLRPERQRVEASDQRRLCRTGSRVVTGRTPPGVRHRPLHHQPGTARIG